LRRLYSDQLHVLMAVVGLVLLIACANPDFSSILAAELAIGR